MTSDSNFNFHCFVRFETPAGKNEQIKSKIQECEKMAKDGKFRLRDILSVPMQRILKYPLLLRDLHKYTVDPHSDREGKFLGRKCRSGSRSVCDLRSSLYFSPKTMG